MVAYLYDSKFNTRIILECNCHKLIKPPAAKTVDVHFHVRREAAYVYNLLRRIVGLSVGSYVPACRSKWPHVLGGLVVA